MLNVIERIKKIEINNDILFGFILIVCFTDVMAKGYVLFPVLAIAHISYMCYKGKFPNENALLIFFVILFFSLTYEVIKQLYVIRSVFSLVHHIITPSIAALYGYYIIEYSLSSISKVKRIIYWINIVVLSLFAHGLLNILLESLAGFENLTDIYSRMLVDFWSGELIPATNENALFLFSIIYIMYLLDGRKKRKGTIILFSLISIIIIGTAFMIGSRTFILGLAICFMLLLVFKRNIICKFKFKNVGLLLVSGTAIIMTNIFGIRDILTNSFLVQRLLNGGSFFVDDPRMQMWWAVIRNCFKYPLGGFHDVGNLQFCHNMWIDVLHGTGLIPFLILLLITVVYIYFYINYLLKMKDKADKLILSCFGTLLFLLCSLEPIIDGYYYIFIIFFMFFGMFINEVEIIGSEKVRRVVNYIQEKIIRRL